MRRTRREGLPSEKTVGIASLKANLSGHLAAVRHGRTVTVLDRDTPIARIVPYEAHGAALVVRRANRRAKDVKLPAAIPGVDSLSALLEERRDRR